MRRRRVVVAGLGACGVIATAWLVARSADASRSAPRESANRTTSAQPENARAEATAGIVANGNREAAAQRAAFEADGWQQVDDVPPPDPQLLAYDPALLVMREAELRQQLATNVPQPDNVANVAAIARRAHDDATRSAAIAALGRIRDEAAQHALIDLVLARSTTAEDRDQALALLRPTDLDAAIASDIAHLLDAPQLSASEHETIAFMLAMIGARDGMTLSDDVLASLSPAARALLERSALLVRRQGGPS